MTAFEQGEILILLHLLWYGTSIIHLLGGEGTSSIGLKKEEKYDIAGLG